jgi:NAD-dependent deacetylase
MENKKKLQQKANVVVLTGAGISAESGLKTFRDSDGLWEGYNVYEVATPIGFKKNPQLVLDFYNMRRKDILAAQPNAAHKALAHLEYDFNTTIITQNIDDLHERGGSKNVVHLHGEIFKMCSVADKEKTYSYTKDLKVGDLAPDGYQLRPFIVWFQEAVPMMEKAIDIVQEADVFVVIGTSLQVYPAASLLNYVSPSAKIIVIDKVIPPLPTSLKNIVVIEEPATKGVERLREILKDFS